MNCETSQWRQKQMRMRAIRSFPVAAMLAVICIFSLGEDGIGADVADASRNTWTHGLPQDEAFFPIGVWLQSPGNAARYKAAGINLYVALWKGPTAEQLIQLEKAGMRVICAQNEYALANKDSQVIAGWMHDDEPDNAQSLGRGKG